MGFAELIQQIQTLPETKQAEVIDFVAFLAKRNQTQVETDNTLSNSSLAELIRNPLRVSEFTPFSREDANAR